MLLIFFVVVVFYGLIFIQFMTLLVTYVCFCPSAIFRIVIRCTFIANTISMYLFSFIYLPILISVTIYMIYMMNIHIFVNDQNQYRT